MSPTQQYQAGDIFARVESLHELASAAVCNSMPEFRERLQAETGDGHDR